LLHAAFYLVAFLLSLVHPSWTRFMEDAIGLSPRVWREFFPFVPVWQVVSYSLLHSTSSLLHLLQNMLYLYFFGTMVEGAVGSSRFLVTYVMAILVGGIAYLVQGLWVPTLGPVIGASGGVFGILVAAATMMPQTRVILIFVPVKLVWLAVGLVSIEVFVLLPQLRYGGSDGVAHLVHLGGALYGFLAVRRRWIWADPIQKIQVRRAISQEERRISDEQRVDQLLQKINQEGLNSLSRREKDFLKRASARR
jgi:membrane associated rhomboid family serine protease